MALRSPSLPAADVHAWIVSLDVAPNRLAVLEAHLSPDERERAARFHRDADRSRFVATRGMLRELLSTWVGLEPGHLSLAASPDGKPSLDPRSGLDLRFNASHSGPRAAFAVAEGREVGVDLERLRDHRDLDAMARRALSPSELAAWRKLAPDARTAAFHRAWTRKEAYTKARGRGLRIALESVEMEPIAGSRALTVREPGGDADRWLVRDLEVEPGYCAAVAAAGEDWSLAYGSDQIWSNSTGSSGSSQQAAIRSPRKR